MDEIMQIIWVWAALVVVMVSYVAFRLVTDRRDSGKRHPLYPLISRAGDGMFPHSSEKNAWLTYLFLGVGFLALLGDLLFEVFGLPSLGWLGPVAGLCIIAGTLSIVLRHLKNRGSR